MTESIRDQISNTPQENENRLHIGLVALSKNLASEAPSRDATIPTEATDKSAKGEQRENQSKSGETAVKVDPEAELLKKHEENLPPETPFTLEPTRKPIVITDKEFDELGPDNAKLLRDAGVVKMTIEVGTNNDRGTIELKKPLDITPNPPAENLRKIEIDRLMQANVRKDKAGSIYVEDIRGLSAVVNVLGAWQNVPITRVVLTPTADGKTMITVTGQVGFFPHTQSSIKPGDLYKQADALTDKLDEIKKNKKLSPDAP